jgi:hypothetical protein
MSNLTLVDRQALLFGLLVSTYGEDQKFNVSCNRCGESMEVAANITNNMEITLYSGTENILNMKPVIHLPVSGYDAVLSAPTILDETQFAASKGVKPEVLKKADDYLIIKEIHADAEQVDPKTGEKTTKKIVIDGTFEIYAMFQKLPARDRKVVTNAWTEHFGNYGVFAKISSKCGNCGSETETYINFLGEIFRLCQ